MNRKFVILIVDDDDFFRTRLARAFAERSYEVVAASGFAEAVAIADQKEINAAVIDLRMPGESGLDLLQWINTRRPETRIVILTGYGSIATAIEAVKLGAIHYLTKPVSVDEIEQALFGDGVRREVTGETETPSLAQAEWEHMQRVINDCDGNISKASKLLGIHRRSLQRKLSKLP